MTKPTQENWMQRTGATPGKLALIAVLAVVLGYVIISQLPSGNKLALQPRRPRPSVAARQGNQPSRAEASKPSNVVSKIWPKAELNKVVAHDPFAVPTWATEPEPEPTANEGESTTPQTVVKAVEDRKKKLETLISQGAAVIVVVDGQKLAMVGDQQLRVGDRIDGFVVTDITDAGIVLAGEGTD